MEVIVKMMGYATEEMHFFFSYMIQREMHVYEVLH